MKQPPDLRLLALVVATSALTAFATAHLFGVEPPPPAPAATAAPLPEPAAGPAPEARVPPRESAALLAAALQRLEQENRELRARIEQLERRPTRIPAAEPVTREELAALEAKLQQPRLPPQPELKLHVAEALTTLRREEAVAKAEQTQSRRAEQLDERVAYFSKWLQLDSYQAGEMRRVLTQQDQREQALLQMWAAGVEDRVLGRAKQSHADEFRTEVTQILTPAQRTEFEQRYPRK